MLRVRDLAVGYPTSGPVLHAVTLTLTLPGPGLHAIIGPNGAGKTTLLHTLAGQLRPASGSIHLDGQDVTGWHPTTAARAGVALAPQGRRLWKSLTVGEHFATVRTTVRDDDRWSVEALLEMFPALAARLGHRADQLSGGEQQMLTIARALHTAPRLLLADEPTEGLAPALAAHIMTVLTDLPARGVTVVVALPHAAGAARAATVHLLTAGRLRESADTADTVTDTLRRHLTLTDAEPTEPAP
ncbi:ATP-binding cassette domain-containing protein [Micromonospora sp. WMMD1082]|uniref:ABC transporter ATP-binding protein n=1 Tax=Micromonospora sp. WMMD1082 TaxID=3016104 RepID=UPI002417A54F|nr:ATP-binding cassette domain-containing protein [Micromonospora sp. WMMD1082]MDG4795509.1 ATP-binding cassette domain-containing protein [Micromonospora sp. WMMD1082]